MKGIQLGPHRVDVPGYHEADALTDCCEQCHIPTRPAAVIDETRGGRIKRRYGIYRCMNCEEAWLCSWAPPGKLAEGLRDRTQDRRDQA